MQDKSYITIQSWMRTDLGLKGNDLLVYAIIYGFSQDGESTFSGSLSYLADWCGCTRQGIQKNLNKLIEQGLVEKSQAKRNGVIFNRYSCRVVNIVAGGGKHSCRYNIVDNKEKDISIINDRNREPVVKTKSLYQKCLDEISVRRFSAELDKLIREYLSLRWKMTDKPIYAISQWNALLNKLNELASDDVAKIAIVKQSIERGYASFFPVAETKRNMKRRAHDDGVSCEQLTENERLAARKWRKEMEKKGERVKF